MYVRRYGHYVVARHAESAGVLVGVLEDAQRARTASISPRGSSTARAATQAGWTRSSVSTNSDGEAAANASRWSCNSMENPCGARSPSRAPGSCQAKGADPPKPADVPAGAAVAVPAAASSASPRIRITSASGPPGRHALSTRRPSALATRAISRAAALASGAKITPNTDTSTSALASGSGSAPARDGRRVPASHRVPRPGDRAGRAADRLRGA